MFDLFRSRTKSVRYLLGGLLGLVALSLVITLIPGFSGASSRADDDVLARVGDNTIYVRQVHQAISMQMREGKLTRDTARYYVPQMINQMIAEFATMYEAKRLGLQATDAEVVNTIRQMMPMLFQDGKFAGSDVYRRFLESNGMTVAEFEENVRKQVVLKKLQSVAFEGEIVNNKEVEEAFRRQGQKVRLEIVKFAPEVFTSQVSVSRAEMEDYLAKNPGRFQTPAKRAFEVIVVDEQKLGESVPVTDAALQAAYSSQKERWVVDDRVRARHILLKTADVPKEKHAEIRKKAEDLLKQIKGGADFAELAKKNSEDPGSASRGGDLDWVVKGQTVPNFEKAVFALKPNEVSGIVETEFGYHIIQAQERETGRVKPFDEVKAELATELRRQQVFDRMPELAEQARAELIKAPAAAESIAKKLGLGYARVARAAWGDPIPLVGVNPDFERVVYNGQKGLVTDVIQLPANKLAVAVVNEVFPPEPAKLADVESELKKTLQQEKAAKLAQEKSRQFNDKLNSNGRDLLRAAREMNLKIIDSGEVDRGGGIEGVGTPMIFGEIVFMHPVGTVVGPYSSANTVYFYRVAGKKEADMADLPNQREAIVTSIRGQKMIQRRELFEDGLVQSLTKEGKIKVNEEALKRIMTTYGS